MVRTLTQFERCQRASIANKINIEGITYEDQWLLRSLIHLSPDNQFRKSLAFYYLSPIISIKNENKYRKKAKYIITDEKDKNNVELQTLCELRANRRLTNDDIQKYLPNWNYNNF